MNRVVRVFDVRSGQLDARDVYRGTAGVNVQDVAFLSNSDTLFVASYEKTSTSGVYGSVRCALVGTRERGL